MGKKLFFLLITALSFLLFSGCLIGRLTANLDVAKDIENPVIIDFVFVFDDAVLNELHKTPSAQWFQKRDQYLLDWGTSNKIQVLSYEMIAGEHEQVKHFKPKSTPIELVIYASYLSPGDHRVVVKDYSYMSLIMKRDDIAIKVRGVSNNSDKL